MQRITESDLRNLLERLNKLTGETFTLYRAYSGVSLQAPSTHNNVLAGGCMPKRALWDKMHAFIAGIEFERRQRESKHWQDLSTKEK